MDGVVIGALGVRVEGEREKMRAINLGCLVLHCSCSKKKKRVRSQVACVLLMCCSRVKATEVVALTSVTKAT